MSRTEAPRPELAPGPGSALVYPNAALSGIFDDIFFAAPPRWPFTYEQIFSTAFARMPANNQRLCQPSLDPNATVGRIREETSPTPDQMQLLQKLGGALGAASGFLAKACPSDVPDQPVARLQVMESQIEQLTMAIDIVRQPLQDFEQSLNADQLAKLDAGGNTPKESAKQPSLGAQACDGSPASIDWSISEINRTVQPTQAQRGEVDTVKDAFRKAADDLKAHCPASVPHTALGRLEAIEARLDATWRSVLSIQVALGNFQNKLSAEQKDRLDRASFAAR